MSPAQLFALSKVGSLLISTLVVCCLTQDINARVLPENGSPSGKINAKSSLAFNNSQIFGRATTSAEEMSDNSRDANLVEVARSLNEAGLFTESTYNRALREVEQGIIQLRSQLLSKLVEQDSSHPYTIFASLEVDDISEIQHIVEQLDSDLEQLNGTGIISASVYEYLKGEVASGRLFHKLQLYQKAREHLQREESVDPDLLKPRLDALETAGILSEQGYASLLKALEAAELQNPIEFLTYIEQAQMFDLNNYPTDPALYFPSIYQSVAQMLSRTSLINGDISEFELELIPDQELNQIYDLISEGRSDVDEVATDGWQPYDALVSVQIDDRHYEQISFYSPSSDEQDFLGRIESDGLVNLFNKVLRDQSSPYRLFGINSFNPHVDYSRFGVIALTEAQADAYWKGSWHGADYTSTFTSDRIAEIVALLSDIEILEHLSADETFEGEKRIARQYITHTHQLLSAFKNVVLLFDWEGAGGESPYRYLLESLSDISHGAFSPTDIEDTFDWENQTASIAFTLNKTRYSTDLDFNHDWLDPEFFKFVDSAVAKESLIGQFYPLSQDGYDVEGYIFLNDRQFEALRSQQLITLPTE